MTEERNRPDADTGAKQPTLPSVASSMTAESVEQKFLEHFGLHEQPFGVTPDPRFLYLSPKHKQALAALNFGTDLNRGFLTLIAPPGLGKTSLLFNYLEGLRDHARTVYLFQTNCDSRELMSYLLAELGLDAYGKGLPEMHSMLNRVLMEEMRLGRRFVLVIDEAQNLTEDVLETVRLLSNFETPWMKLMQIVLAGQPQLAERLARPSLAQLNQRISLAAQIEPLSIEEVGAYMDHRLWVAGYQGTPLFSVGARTLIAEHSNGVPRQINNACFCAMSFAWATKKETIDRETMREVIAGMSPSTKPKTLSTPNPVELSHPVETPSVMLPGPQPPVLTVKEPPARGWLPGIAVAAAVFALAVWLGIRFDLGKRAMVYWDGISTAGKVSAAPAHEPVLEPTSVDPATPDVPDDFSGVSGSGTSSEGGTPTGAQQRTLKSPPSMQQPD